MTALGKSPIWIKIYIWKLHKSVCAWMKRASSTLTVGGIQTSGRPWVALGLRPHGLPARGSSSRWRHASHPSPRDGSPPPPTRSQSCHRSHPLPPPAPVLPAPSWLPPASCCLPRCSLCTSPPCTRLSPHPRDRCACAGN